MSAHKIGPGVDLYVRSMGKRLRVLEVCTSVDEANARMASVDSLAVVAESDGLILLADKWDKGERAEAGS